ncbi:MAG: SDR family NAD(P)-dependent oxidoreductase [Legionella sp.]|nr:SDR family NAD(P)-dependent oxidoreductase [Legionella sp.]
MTKKNPIHKLTSFNEPLAIIGMNCQFPGIESDIEDVDSFFNMLLSGQSPIKEVPKDRWDIDAYYSPDRKKADKIITRQGGFLQNTQLFDAEFFKLSSVETKQIDPQHRLFLEVSIRALNHANLRLDSIEGSDTGVYCGISSQDYNQLNFKDKIQFNAYTQLGVAGSAAVGRLCHFLNLKGPSMVVDTACSSSFTALYLAVMALRSNHCSLALVGGVQLNLCPENFIGLSKAHMLSPQGQCRSFDSQANGFVRSEGCGVVIIKRLSDAIRDKDTIHAVIKSVVMNQDGDGTSLVAPNIDAQIRMHEAALEQANLIASDIDYIEAHGTGTALGDRVEFNAIQAIHQGHHHHDNPLIIGALKSTIGHTIASSGLASLIKAVTAINKDCIPPNLHYSSPNASIDPESIPSVLPLKAMKFTKNKKRKRRVQVSNFGFSGTNVGVIIEEPPSGETQNSELEEEKLHCFMLSANSESSLNYMLAQYEQFLQVSSASLHDICATLRFCRDHYKFRCIIQANNRKVLLKKIQCGDYEIKKVVINKEITITTQHADELSDLYLSGARVDSNSNQSPYRKVALPLYPFDRQAYWHEARPSKSSDINEPIAIIGMSCRFPKACDVDAFLSLLQHGGSGLSDIPLERWNNEDFYSDDEQALGKLCNKQMGLMDGIKQFDAEFFNISPREAKIMSPQLRILMEISYHALENANLSLDTVKNSSTGVFIGCERNDYPYVLYKQGYSLEDLDIYFATGNALSALPGRIAYAFDLKGPTQLIDTACSSSLTAIHNACLSLQNKECTMALAGGINVILSPLTNIMLSKADMLSPDSRCKSFSDDADGYARGEGCGMIVLKPLRSAIQDKDTILAVIKGSAINSDGKSAGFTVPNGKSQEAVIRGALEKSNLLPKDIDFIETHGTGTPLADPIEFNTLTSIFSEGHSEERPLFISAVKTNIGHCESASGVAGLIKAVLSLQTKTLFKHLNFRRLNPAIQLKNTTIPLQTLNWVKEGGLRFAGVNSFGFTGANAHVVLQEAPLAEQQIHGQPLPNRFLLVISAKNKSSLECILTSYQEYLVTTQDRFADICYTAAISRQHFLYRVALIAGSAQEAAHAIKQYEYSIYQQKQEEDFLPEVCDLEQLQRAFQEGFIIDFKRFYSSHTTSYKKVRLPLYQFAKTEYWFDYKDEATLFQIAAHQKPEKKQTDATWISQYLNLEEPKKFQACIDLLLGITKKIQELSKTDHIDVTAGFFDIGFDSLMLTEMAFILQEKFQMFIQISVHIGFDYPSIEKLAAYLRAELDYKLNSKQKNVNQPQNVDDTIAIIGMSCSFPNAPNIEAFEQLLEQGLSGIKDIPVDRWDNKLYYDSNKDAQEKSYVKQLGLIEDIKTFDAHFFGISPREACLMDPQQRLFLEGCYHALEHANYPTHTLRGSQTGVFAGVSVNEFYTQMEKSCSSDTLSMYSITGNALNVVSGRVAHIFDFKGPAISIDTACSSSLVAIHYACQSLKTREIDYALAGGVNILLMPESNITLCKARALSAQGLCKTFDESADGFTRSEGCGVLLLKRLADAVRDQDTILAVIKATAVNNDGTSAGLTAPNCKSQEDVMLKALNQTELTSLDISYVEAHGTGTPLGDPIEVQAINRVYGRQRPTSNPLYIGSVKTNLGHLESASGIASMIKTVLALQKNKIYKHLHFKSINPNINIENTRIALQTIDWSSSGKPKVAGVNAFGFSGTNAHAILQAYSGDEIIQSTNTSKKIKNILVLSAKSRLALDSLSVQYQHFLKNTQKSFTDICFTAAICREHYAFRMVVIAEDAALAGRIMQCAHSLGGGYFARSFEKQDSDLESLEDSDYKTRCIHYLGGVLVDWSHHFEGCGGTKVALPLYTFDRKEFWPEMRTKVSIQTQNLPLPINKSTILQHLYHTTWKPLFQEQVRGFAEVCPELIVISKDPASAKRRLNSLKYQLISCLSHLESIENKHILFLYTQDQFMELVHCCQSLYKTRPASFILVTELAYAITDTDEVNPFHTMAGAFWKSFRNELNLDTIYFIDLDKQSTLGGPLATLYDSNNTENVFAVRDKESLFVARVEKKELAVGSNKQAEVFDSNGSYLIVGGNGGLSEPLIDYLIQKQVKHISLVSRSEASNETRALIAHAADKQVIIKHTAADASSAGQMQSIFEEIENSPHPLKGLFHLAGIIQDGLLVNLSDENIHQVLKAKMESALVLHHLTKNVSLDFFVLFSSSASLLGSMGQANYAAANGFLDGLAHLAQKQGLRTLSINWGPFAQIGMAANQVSSLEQRGFIPLDKSCIVCIDALIQSEVVQIAPCPMDWDLYYKYSFKQTRLQLVKKPSINDRLFLNTLRQETKREAIRILSDALCKITAAVLGLGEQDGIIATDSLFLLGADSLMCLEIRHRIHDKLQCAGLSIPIDYFINNLTIEDIAGHISDALQLYFKDEDLKRDLTLNEVPVCDFQYPFWVFNRLGWAYNVGMQLRLQGPLKKEHVLQAFDFVVKNNDVFWLSFSPNCLMQRLNKEGQFNLIYKDLSSNDHSNVLSQEFNTNLMRIIPLTTPPLIRVYLYKISKDCHELHLIMPHIIVDIGSCALIFSQFKSCYSSLVDGTLLHSETMSLRKDSFLNYVQQNNQYYEKNLTDKINFWKGYNKGFKKLNMGAANVLADAAVYQQTHLFHYSLPTKAIDSCVNWHKVNNLNLSSGLITACHQALQSISGQTKIPIMLIHSGREGSPYKSIVGLFSEYKRINICFKKDQSFLECVHFIEAQLLKTAPYQKCALPIKMHGLKGWNLSLGLLALQRLNKLLLVKQFKKSKIHDSIIYFYLKFLSAIEMDKKIVLLKYKFNTLFKKNLPLQQPKDLEVLISITPSFFLKENPKLDFAGIDYTFASHFGCLNRPVGNQVLWIYFSKNQYGESILSINGPLTTACKDQIASEFKNILHESFKVP